jgi:hypothetical protein
MKSPRQIHSMDRCGILQQNNRIGRIAIANQQNRIILKRFEYMGHAEKNSSCHVLCLSGTIHTDRFYCDKICSQVKYRACLMESKSPCEEFSIARRPVRHRVYPPCFVAGWADDVCFCIPRSQLQNHFAFRILFVIPARLPARQA